MELRRVVIVGGGRVGLSLGRLFERAGAEIRAVLVRQEATRVAEFFPGAVIETCDLAEPQMTERSSSSALSLAPQRSVVQLSEAFTRELAEASLILFAVPDLVLSHAVGVLAVALAPTHSPTHSPIHSPIHSLASSRKFLVVHVAGAKSADVLSPFAKLGAAVGVLHPCYPFFEVTETPPTNLAVTFSGDACGVPVLAALFARLGVPFLALPEALQDEDARALYHAANVCCAGHVATLLAAAERVLIALGLSRDDSLCVLRSLLSGEMELLQSGRPLAHGITGPFVRGDENTIQRQIGLLKQIAEVDGSKNQGHESGLDLAYERIGRLSQALLRPTTIT